MKSKLLKKIISIAAAVSLVSGFFWVGTAKAGELSPAGTALEGYYGTNLNGKSGENKNITIDGDFSDWSQDMLIAQGVANDDPRIFRGSHEGPVYDTYALYSAWDNENLYFMWQYTNVTDVVDPAQGYPISDNGKPWNGDIPIMLALNTGSGNTSDGTASDGKNVWGITVNFDTAIDKLLCFSAKPGVGQPAIFSAVDGKFDYDTCLGFKKAGVKYAYGDGFLGNTMYGVNGNGYSGYIPQDLLKSSSNWVDFLTTNHDKNQDTMYEMAIPLSALGITKDYIEQNGIGAMLISTFGASGTGSIPMDMTFLDNACEPYSADDSTSAEKEDKDTVTVPLARVGKLTTGPVVPKPSISSFTASVASPITVGDSVTFNTKASSSDGVLDYKYEVNGKTVQGYSVNPSFTWVPSEAGDYDVKVTVKNGSGATLSRSMKYVVAEKDNSVQVEENNFNIAYTGSWRSLTGSSYSAGSMAKTSEIGAKAVYKFNGTGIKLLSQVGMDKGIAKITIDGKVYPADMCRSTSKNGEVVFEKLDLVEGDHTITVECSGLKSRKSVGTAISIDAFQVLKNN